MTAGTAYTVVGVILAACGACAWSILTGHRAVTRARWAWRCRPRWRYRGRPPVRDEGGEKLSYEEARALGNLAAARRVRSRT